MHPLAASLFLFVPADRPERFDKALGAGADAVIVDLEDAVAVSGKTQARGGMAAALATLDARRVFVRVNGAGPPWHAEDLDAASSLDIAGIVLPKAENVADIEHVRQRLGDRPVLAIVESAQGLAGLDEIATAADRLAFGSIDFAADLGCAHGRDALLLARSRIVLAARIARRPAPVDGVTQAIRDEAAIEADARYGVSLGFGGKLLIHPAQILPARRGMAPDDADVQWAAKILAGTSDSAAVAVDGAMVDAPVLGRARQILDARDRYLNVNG